MSVIYGIVFGMNNVDTPMNIRMNYGMNHLINCYCMNGLHYLT
jgi:hypothetical protein